MLKEFDIIKHYFMRNIADHPEIIQGIGDDAAVWQCENATLVTSVDTLVEGRHFFPDCAPEDVAYKALAVNLSDFAAMGAQPRWFTLALTLPKADAKWLEKFSESLFALAKDYNLALIGGDTTQGPLCVTIQIIGTVDKTKMLLRSGAKVGDLVYVSGILGDAGLALKDRQNKSAQKKLNRPQPQVALGLALAGHAHAAIDISDGLAQDLNHILQASGVGARLHLEKLPISAQGEPLLALTAGDDYELCFTIEKNNPIIEQLTANYLLTCIGEIILEPGLRIYQSGQLITPAVLGWQHFN
ncbi:MAG: thiamine-phosphate kinase [Legionellales bacterium]|jgi:thiamine-monophosphate kinase